MDAVSSFFSVANESLTKHMTTRWKEIWRGKSFGRAAMNVVLSRWLAECRGRWLDIGGGMHPSYEPLISPACERIATDVVGGDGRVALDANAAFPFPDQSVDGVVALNMLYILEQPQRTLEEIRRVLKPQGGMIASFPFFFSENPEPHDYWRWTKEGVEKTLKDAGFRDIQIERAGGPGSAFAMTLMPLRGVLAVRVLVAPIIFLWDDLSRSQATSFWVVACTVV